MSASTPKSPKTLLSWTIAIAHALEAKGVSSQELFEKAGVPYLSITDPDYRIESLKTDTLLKLAAEATDDPCFALKTVPYLHAANLHAFGYSLYSSSTLHEFCQRLVRFFRLLSESVQHHLSEEEDDYRLTLEIINPNLGNESLDSWIGNIVHMCRTIYRPNFKPLRVELMRPKPESHAEDYDNFFKSPVIFSAQANVIYFDKHDMHVPLPTANKELAQRNDEVIIEHLARLDRDDIIRQVEAKIVELLPTGDCSREIIASRLNMSSRSLLNKLEDKGTSYKEILEQLRSSLAQQYIEQHNKSISEITYLLGFSDTSSFSRAFRRWTGKSPSDYRAHNSANGDTA